MKRFSLAAGAGLLAMAAFATPVAPAWIEFSSPGPDKYADGETVVDGEIYALVYVKGEGGFKGINPDGTVVDPATSKIICRASWAKNGGCPRIIYAIDESCESDGFTLTGGKYEVYLFDTRVSEYDPKTGALVKTTAGLKDGKAVFTGWERVGGTVSTNQAVEPSAPVAISAGNVPAVPLADAAALQPAVKGISVRDGLVYVEVENVKPGLKYEIIAWKKLGDKTFKTFCKGVQGTASGVLPLVYKDDPADRYSFFKVRVSGLKTAE